MSRNRQAVQEAAVKAEMTLGIYHDKIDDLHPRSLRRRYDPPVCRVSQSLRTYMVGDRRINSAYFFLLK